jgi:hypothetical protein
MKHILNEMSEEEKDSIRSQHTGTLKVQTERFKKLVENKLGNAKPLVSEQLESFTAFDESENEDDGINYPKINLRKHFDKERELNPDLMGDDEWDEFNNDFEDEDIEIYDRKHFDKERELEEDDSDYRMYDLPSIHQDIEDELMEMSDDESLAYLNGIIEFCEDKLNSYDSEEDDFEDDTLNEQSTEDVNKGKKTGCYTVKSGDTVLAIANKFGITLDDVRALNGMTSTNSITPGQKLRVKNGTKFIGC